MIGGSVDYQFGDKNVKFGYNNTVKTDLVREDGSMTKAAFHQASIDC